MTAIVVVTAPAEAQFIVELRAGATASSNLVSDIIVDEVSARPAIAPTLAVSIGTRLDSLYTVHLTGGWSRSDVRQRNGGASATIVSLTAWQGSVSLRRRITRRIAVHTTLGVFKYAPSQEGRDATLFRGDAPAVPMAGIGASISHRVAPEYTASLAITWDVHRFTTAALTAVGFDGRRTVHRVFLGTTIRREFRDATP